MYFLLTVVPPPCHSFLQDRNLCRHFVNSLLSFTVSYFCVKSTLQLIYFTLLWTNVIDIGECVTFLQASATSLVQSKWFELAGQRNSDIDTVQTTLSYLEQNYSRAVLEYIINLTDGNVSRIQLTISIKMG